MGELVSADKLEQVYKATEASWQGLSTSGPPVPLKVDKGYPTPTPWKGLGQTVLAESALGEASAVTVQPHSWWSEPWLLGWPRWMWAALGGGALLLLGTSRGS